MKNLMKPALILSALICVGLASCNRKGCTDPLADNYSDKAKKDDGSCTYGNYVADFDQFFEDNRTEATQSFTVNGATGGTINATGGTVIQVPAGAFVTASGDPITGTVDIDVLEILDASDMILMGVPTVTASGILVTGGELKVTATSGGSTAYLASGSALTVYVPYASTPDASMSLYDGTEDADGDVTWTAAPDSSFTTTADSTGGWYTFEWSDSTLGWINCDYFYSDPSPKTILTVNVSGDHTWDNTAVFIHFPTLPALSNAYVVWGDTDENSFNSGSEIPIGLDLNVVVISEIAGTYYSSISSISLTSGLVLDLTLTETTLSDLEAAILAL